MKKTTFIILSCLIFSINATNAKKKSEKMAEKYIQEIDPLRLNDAYSKISLKRTIEQGLRNNYDQQIRVLNREILGLEWKDTFDSFWFPQVEMFMDVYSQRIGTLKKGSKKNPIYNTSSVDDNYSYDRMGISLGNYTLFNWGIDYLKYKNKKDSYRRHIESLSEEMMKFKHNLVLKYFELLATKRVEELRRKHVRQTSYIYRLNKERHALKKISKKDYLLSRYEYLKAQKKLQLARKDSEVVDENMSFSIQDPPGTRYSSDERLKYKKINITITNALQVSLKNNSKVQNAKKNLANAFRDYEINLKENLPLPKFSINLGAYTHYFGDNLHHTQYETNNINSNIELEASINASWTIFGKNGLFNSRKREKAFINKEISSRRMLQAKHRASTDIREYYRKTVNLQGTIEILHASSITLRSLFDSIMDDYVNKKATFTELKDILDDLIETEVQIEKLKVDHLKHKITLADTIGLEELPGNVFENLAYNDLEPKQQNKKGNK